jgi:hypothetical protein
VKKPPVSTHVTRNDEAPERRHLATQVGFGSVRSERRPGSISIFFVRNVEPHRVGFENRRDLGEFLTGGW